MTAFDEILKAEQEADQAIATAKEESAVAVQNARIEQQEKLQQEETALAAAAAEATTKEKARVAEKAKRITDEVQTQVLAVEQNFQRKKEEVKTAVKQRFQ